MTILKLLNSGIFWGIIGIIIAILSYYLSKGKRTIIYSIQSIPLIDKRMAQILDRSVTIDETPIETLTLTTICFSNRGNQTIEPHDFARVQPLSISTTGRFLPFEESRQVVSAPATSCLQLNAVNEKEIHIEFDYVKPKQFFVIKVLHDGDLSVSGDIKAGNIQPEKSDRFYKSLCPIIIIGLIVVELLALFSIFFPDASGNSDAWKDIAYYLFEGQLFLSCLWIAACDGFPIQNLFRKTKKK